MILVVAVALWLFWVAPYMMRQRGAQLGHQGAGVEPASAHTRSTVKTSEGVLLMKASSSPESLAPARTTPGGGASAARPVPGRLQIRYGRLGLAAVGLLALLTAVIGGALSAAALVPAGVPAVAAMAGFGAIAVLRTLAVRDRKAKAAARAAARRSTASLRPSQGPAQPRRGEGTTAPRPQAQVFDAEAAAPKRSTLSAIELRQAALAVAAEAGDTAAAAAQEAAAREAAAQETWEPVQVPKPTYVGSAKAERPEPAPLAMPEPPKPSAKTSIKQTAPQKAQPEPAAKSPAPAASKGASALSNLDDVLQRRRA
ncbi:hypothetical protein KIH31_00155 [Paenarthrobacter sp. DKR-5]|nr:hypothetical protein [Paenarthrobacter sp. DKR-5]